MQLSSQLFTSWDTYSCTSTCWLPQHLVILWLTSRFKWYLIPPFKNPPSLKKKSPIKLLLGFKIHWWTLPKSFFMGRFKNRDFLSLSFHLYLLLAIFLLKKKSPSSTVLFPWKKVYKSQHKCLILSFYLLMFRAEINKLFPCNRPDSKYFRLCRPCGLSQQFNSVITPTKPPQTILKWIKMSMCQ